MAELRPHADRVHKISIIPRGVAALGYTEQRPTEDRYLLTRAERLDRLDVLLGGRVAEESSSPTSRPAPPTTFSERLLWPVTWWRSTA